MMDSVELLITLLEWTANPSKTKHATYGLEEMKPKPGFLKQLMMICRQSSFSFQVRFSAVIYLKNTIEQASKQSYSSININNQDYEFVKHALLESMVLLIAQKEKKILEIMKQICYLLIKRYFKEMNGWDELLNQTVEYIQRQQNEESVRAALIVAKILFRTFGKSLTEQKKLNYIANKLILPIRTVPTNITHSLSNEFTLFITAQMFRILTDAIEFHLPDNLRMCLFGIMQMAYDMLNIDLHQTQQLNINSKSIIGVLKLRIGILKFLEKLYQRHATSNLLSLKQFVTDFNTNYTKGIFNTIVGIIMQKLPPKSNHPYEYFSTNIQCKKQWEQDKIVQQRQVIRKLSYELYNIGLGVISFICSNSESSKFLSGELQEIQLKLLSLSMQRFLEASEYMTLQRRLKAFIQAKSSNYEHKQSYDNIDMTGQKWFENYSDFTERVNEQRLQLRLFISVIFGNKQLQNKDQHVELILALLFNFIQKGTLKEQQLAIYLLSSLEKQIQILLEERHQSQSGTNDIKNKIQNLIHYSFLQFLTVDTNTNTSPEQTLSQQPLNPKQQILKRLQLKQEKIYRTLIKLRCYQVYTRFEYIKLTPGLSVKLCQTIYSQLMTPVNNQFSLFVKIQAVELFNFILSENEQLVPLMANNTLNILQIYTLLLQKDYELIRFYDEILSLFSPYISQIVYQILDLLVRLYHNVKKSYYQGMTNDNMFEGVSEYYRTQQKQSHPINQRFSNTNDLLLQEEQYGHEHQQGEQQIKDSDSEDTVYDDKRDKYNSIGAQCLASIKKLIFKHQLNLSDTSKLTTEQVYERVNLADRLMLMALNGLTTRDQSMVRESLGVINLLLLKGFVTEKYQHVFPIFVYPVLLTDNQNNNQNIQSFGNFDKLKQSIKEYLLTSSKSNNTTSNMYNFKTEENKNYQQNNEQLNSQYQKQFRQILSQIYSNISDGNNFFEADSVFQFSDTIGCLKNGIKLIGSRLRQMVCPFTGRRMVEMLIQMVVIVVDSKGRWKKSDGVAVLGVLESMLENRIFPNLNSVSNTMSNSNQINMQTSNHNSIDPNLHLLFSLIVEKWSDQSRSGQHNKCKRDELIERLFESGIVRLLMIACYSYPEQFFEYIYQWALKHQQYQQQQYSQQTQFGQYNQKNSITHSIVQIINTKIIQMIIQSTRPMAEILGKQKQKHHLQEENSLQGQNESQESDQQSQQQQRSTVPILQYLILKGATNFVHVILDKFIFDAQSQQSIPLQIFQLPLEVRIMLSKFYMILSRLSLQVCFFAFKQVVGEQFKTQLSNQERMTIKQELQRIDRRYSLLEKEKGSMKRIGQQQQMSSQQAENGLISKGNGEQQLFQVEKQNEMLAQMFSCLNIGGLGNFSGSLTNNIYTFSNNGQLMSQQIRRNEQMSNQKTQISISTPSLSQQFEQQYDQHVKMIQTISPEVLISQIQEAQVDSQASNPFQKIDEQYLLVYSSVVTETLNQKNKKLKLSLIMHEVIRIHTDKKIFYLQEVFKQSLSNHKKQQQE